MSRKKSSLAKSATHAKEESVGITIFVKPSEIEALNQFKNLDACAEHLGTVDAICDRVIFAYAAAPRFQKRLLGTDLRVEPKPTRPLIHNIQRDPACDYDLNEFLK